jgi:hypothetical protein
MKSNTIHINRTNITCYEDGTVEWLHGRYDRVHRTHGCKNRDGYPKVNIKKKMMSVHRLMAMAFLSDFDESLCVDHIDGDRSNNNLSNLRTATRSQNQRAFKSPRKNATSSYRGVSWYKQTKKWLAAANLNGKVINIGYFFDELEAAMAFDEFAVANGFLPEALNFSRRNAEMVS